MTKKHICEKETIKWDEHPIPSDDCVEWQGTCAECKKRVFEVYVQGDELYDVETSEIIQ